MTRWEWIARRLMVLGDYGIRTEFFNKYIDKPDFLTNDWIDWYFGQPLEGYVVEELNKIGSYDEIL
jgi:hypothetical protein